MKATLYKLKEGYVLCSDEGINYKSSFVDLKDNTFWVNEAKETMSKVLFPNCKKVLTQSPDFSLLSEEDAKRIGWFDVDEMVERFYISAWYPDKHSYKNGFSTGFEIYKEFTADRRFTEEEVKKILFEAVGMQIYSDDRKDFFVHHLIQSISQPKSWQVTISEENGVYKVLSVS